MRPTSGVKRTKASAAASATFDPETATKCASPVSRKDSVSSRGMAASRPMTMPAASEAAGSGSDACRARSSRSRTREATVSIVRGVPASSLSTRGKDIVPATPRRARKAR